MARRLLAEAVAMVFTVRDPEGAGALVGLPEPRVGDLDKEAAGDLLEATVEGRMEWRVRDRLVETTDGNPRALLELSRCRTAADVAHDLDAVAPASLASRVDQEYAKRLALLPNRTRTLTQPRRRLFVHRRRP